MENTILCKNKAIGVTINLLSGKWKILILFSLHEGVKRFSQLQRDLPNITQRMLTNQLRELERDQIVDRTVYPEVPPRVEYKLSPVGQTLSPVFQALERWGKCYLKGQKSGA